MESTAADVRGFHLFERRYRAEPPQFCFSSMPLCALVFLAKH